MSKCKVCGNEFWLLSVKLEGKEYQICRECFSSDIAMRRMMLLITAEKEGKKNVQIIEVAVEDPVSNMPQAKKPRRKRRANRVRVQEVHREGNASANEGGV